MGQPEIVYISAGHHESGGGFSKPGDGISFANPRAGGGGRGGRAGEAAPPRLEIDERLSRIISSEMADDVLLIRAEGDVRFPHPVLVLTTHTCTHTSLASCMRLMHSFHNALSWSLWADDLALLSQNIVRMLHALPSVHHTMKLMRALLNQMPGKTYGTQHGSV